MTTTSSSAGTLRNGHLVGHPVFWTCALFGSPAFAQDEAALGTAIGGVISLLLVIVIGAIVGWLAGLIVKGRGSGLLGNIAAGIGGSILASYGLSAAGLTFGTVGSFIAAVIGAVVIILIVGLIRKAAN